MKILHYISSFSAGGAEIFVKNLSLEMKKRDNQVKVISLFSANNDDYKEKFVDSLNENDIESCEYEITKKYNFKKSLRMFERSVYDFKPDVINIHLGYAALYLSFMKRKLKIPLVFTHHSTPLPQEKLHLIYFRKKIDHYVGICDSSYDTLVNKLNLPANKISKIYNGIPLFSKKRIISEKVKTILCVGNLRKPKNYPFLFKSLKNVFTYLKEQALPLPILKIAGVGSEKNSLMNLAEQLNISEQIYFLGLREDIENLFYTSDLYVIPSTHEGFSISLLEAQASGIPIIATDVGGNSEIISRGKNGLLIESNNIEELTDAIIELYSDKEKRIKFGQEALINSHKFTIEKSASKYLNLYNTMII